MKGIEVMGRIVEGEEIRVKRTRRIAPTAKSLNPCFGQV
jgi:hypothetical protein